MARIAASEYILSASDENQPNEQKNHSILQWSKEHDLYVLPQQDYNQNEGGALLTEDKIRQALFSIGSALQEIHSYQVCYGKVEPENVMINADGRIRLSGFATNVVTPKAKEIVHNIVDDQSFTESEKAKHRVKKEFEPHEMRKVA